jgi:hypothetical protein
MLQLSEQQGVLQLTKLADCEGASLTVEPVKVPGDLTVLPKSTQA